MVKVLALSTNFAVAAAFGCSGSDDPVISGDTCYAGSAGALGLTENVYVTIHSFSSGAGVFDISGTGIESFTCTEKSGTKSGQAISVDFGDDGCLPSAITVKSVKYCSGNDQIKVTVTDAAVPIPVTATLKKVSCGASLPSMFENFVSEFGKAYNGDDKTREEVFNANVELIKENNRKQNGLTMGVNQFADLTNEEFVAGFTGASAPDMGDLPHMKTFEAQMDAPAAVDWVSQGGIVNSVKDQGQCGSCWAFSTMGTLESGYALAAGKLVSGAEQQLVDCDTASNQGCNGGWPYDALSYFKNNAVCSESTYAYTARDGTCAQSSCSTALSAGTISGYANVGTTDAALAAAVATQPVSVTVKADSTFQMYSSGVASVACSGSINHAVIAVGYGTENGKDYFKIRNSWGSSWGDAGYIKVARNVGSQGSFCLLQYNPVVQTLSAEVQV